MAGRLAAEVREFDSVISIPMRNARGEYVGFSRDADDMPLTLAIADDSTAHRLVAYKSDERGRRLQEYQRSTGPFDARRRPWYAAATPPGRRYGHLSTCGSAGTLGMDVVTPVHGPGGEFKGVLDTSLTLTGVGRFLKSIRPTPHSEGFIMEASGLLVASSSTAVPYARSGDSLERIEAAKSAAPPSAQAPGNHGGDRRAAASPCRSSTA